jgi:hypothetical protein
VPNVDQITLSYEDDIHGTTAFLEPKGIELLPSTVRQVLEAVSCILEALVVSLSDVVDHKVVTTLNSQVMHKGPMPIFHRDIRWPNVMRRADDPTRWFLMIGMMLLHPRLSQRHILIGTLTLLQHL